MGSNYSHPWKCLQAGCLLLPLVLAGCATDPTVPATASAIERETRQGHPALRIATSLIGTPYRFGGDTPRGFDCSGLVFYAYGKAGIRVPRTTRAQFRHSRQVSLSELHPGDLLFFRLGREQISHVGIYAGNGHFIHAPSQGKQVSYTSMANSYWKTRLLAAGRYH